MGIIGHIIGTAIGTFFRAIFFGLIGGIITAGIAFLISTQGMHQAWPLPLPTYIIGGIVAVLAAYATGVTVILRAIVRDALTAAKDVGRDIEKAV
jgi:hypothetical protein